MSSPFRRVTDHFWTSPQIAPPDLAAARAQGIVLVINNRPEGESPEQSPGAEIEQGARALGLDYCAIPVTPAGFSEAQVDALIDALEGAKGPVLAYCRSGTRSTLLWALAQARLGSEADQIAADAAAAGYDVSPIRPLMDMLAKRSGS